MKLSLLVCVVLSVVLSILFVEVTSQTVSCERIGTENAGHGSLKTCFMNGQTTINTDGFVISPADSSVEAIRLDDNKKIHFLPIRIDESFPNTVFYHAPRCSIKTVSKKNFVNLKKLKFLYLGYNQIERIDSDTFADSTLLEVLHLNQNKIKQINGAAFSGLSKLTYVNLNRNVCIQKYYSTPAAIVTLTRDVTEKCGFTEVAETTENISNVVQSLNASMEKLMKENRELLASKLETAASAATMSADILALTSQLKVSEDSKLGHQAEIEALKATLKSAEDANSAHQAEIEALKLQPKAADQQHVEIAVLKATLKAAEDCKSEKQAENMATMAMMSQLVTNLGAQCNAQCNITCIERTKDLSQTVEIKLKEISGLLDEQATNRAAMKEKTAEIALLKSKLEDLSSN